MPQKKRQLSGAAFVRKDPTNSHLWAKRTPQNTPVVAILWRDIQAVENWNDGDEVAPARNCYTIGYLLYQGPDPEDDTREMTVIASWYCYDDGKWSQYVAFPSEVIREVKALTKVRKSR